MCQCSTVNKQPNYVLTCSLYKHLQTLSAVTATSDGSMGPPPHHVGDVLVSSTTLHLDLPKLMVSMWMAEAPMTLEICLHKLRLYVHDF